MTDGVAKGTFTTVEPREAARAIIALCTSVVKPFASMQRSVDDVIRLYQGFARAIATS